MAKTRIIAPNDLRTGGFVDLADEWAIDRGVVQGDGEVVDIVYPDVETAELNTSVGKFFRIWNGDTPRTYSRYERTSEGSELMDPLATSLILASNYPGQGRDLIGQPTLEELLASTTPSRGVGSIWHTERYNYIEAEGTATDHDLITAGGVKLYVDTSSTMGVSILAYHTGGSNIRPALLTVVAAVKAGRVPSRHIVIPWRSTPWEISAQTLIDTSNITLTIAGDIRLTATTAQHALLFAPNADATPSTSIENVRVIGLGRTLVDGNADAMIFPEPTPGTVDTYSAVRFNAVKGLSVWGIHATNGAMDAMSCKRCPHHLIENCEMSNSLWDNGFSATTDPADYDQEDPATWGGGTVRNCVSHGNRDVGFTAFNCSGQWFQRCRSWDNDAGYSYEDSFGTPNIKKYFGGFQNCHAFNCRTSGFYVDGDEVVIDDDCSSYNIRGTTLDNTNNLYENGVLVSSVNRCYIGGRHENNGRCGVAAFNASGLPMEITIAAECVGNDWHGAYLREQKRIKVLPRAKFLNNGLGNTTLGEYGHGIFATSTTIAMTGTGSVDIDGCEISGNAFRAIRISGYKRATVRDVYGENNFQYAPAGSGVGIQFQTMNTAVSEGNELRDTTGRQTFIVNFTNDVVHGRDIGTRGDFATGMVANAATTTRYSTKPSGLTVAQTWDIPAIASMSREALNITVPGVEAGDFGKASFSDDMGMRVWKAEVLSGGTVTVFVMNFTNATIPAVTRTVRVSFEPRNAR